METRKKLFGVMKKVACLALVFVMAVTFVNPMTAQAKTKKLNLTPSGLTWRTDLLEGLASAVTTGKYNVNVKMSEDKLHCRGYIKFVAPATKTYSFTVSNAKGGKHGVIGNIDLYTATGTSLDRINVKTSGGETNAIWFAHKYIRGKGTTKANACLPKRTGKVALQQGQVVYLEVEILPIAKKVKKASCTIKIK